MNIHRWFVWMGIALIVCALNIGGGCDGGGGGGGGAGTGAAVTIDENGNILVNESPFLPLILYDAGYGTFRWIQAENASRGIPDRYATFRDQMLDIRSKGFNTILASPSYAEGVPNPSSGYIFTLEDFEKAAELGLYVIPRVDINYANDLSIRSQLQSQSRLIFWNIHDEPELYPAGIQQATQIYNTVRSIDSRPAAVPMSDVAFYPQAPTFTDILFPDTYFSIPNNIPDPADLSELLIDYIGGSSPYPSYATVRDFMANSWTAMRARPRTSVMPVITSNHITSNREPTPAQLRAMSFLALVHDAKGLAFFALADIENDGTDIPTPTGRPHWYLPESPNGLWDAFATILADIKRIDTFVFSGNYMGTATNNQAKVHFKTKMVDGKLWILAVNVLSSAQPAVTFTIDRNMASVREIFSSTTLTSGGVSFTDSFGSYQVRVYEITF